MRTETRGRGEGGEVVDLELESVRGGSAVCGVGLVGGNVRERRRTNWCSRSGLVLRCGICQMRVERRREESEPDAGETRMTSQYLDVADSRPTQNAG